MAKIANDPGKYMKRSLLVSRSKDGMQLVRLPRSAKRAKEFLTVPIDDAFYMDFRPAARKGSRS